MPKHWKLLDFITNKSPMEDAIIIEYRESIFEGSRYKERDLAFPSCSDFGSRYFYPKGELHNGQSIYACYFTERTVESFRMCDYKVTKIKEHKL